MSTSISPAGPVISCVAGLDNGIAMRKQRPAARNQRRRQGPGLPSSLDLQSLDDAAVLDVLVNDLVDVFAVDVGVPDAFGINHHDGALFAAIHTSGRIDPALALARQPKLLDLALGVFADIVRAM